MSRFLLVFFATAALTLTACDSLIDTEPVGSASSEVALEGRTGFSSLLNSAYDRMQSPAWYSNQWMLEPEAQADNITLTNDNSNRYLGPVTTVDQSYLAIWGIAYDAINDANNIIANIEDESGAVNPSIGDVADETAAQFRNRVKGQAHFIRALSYFDLARAYSYEPGVQIKDVQGVIIRTEPTESVEQAAQNLSRASVNAVYDQIFSDLNEAASLLGDVSVSEEPFRVGRAAVLALLSRVHLYAKNYDQAESFASQALDVAPSLVEGGNYVDAFLAETHPESMFTLDMTVGQDGDATFSNQAIASLTIPGNFAFEVIPSQDADRIANGLFQPENDDPLTSDLIGAFDAENDVRFGLFAPSELAGQEFLYSQKWLDTEAGFVTNIVILRTSELYLNRAEARYEQGNTSGAQSDVNVIRTRAGLDETSVTGTDLLEEILFQRRLEFNMEGQRWWDLKRRGQAIPKPQGLSPRPFIPYDNFVLLSAIPGNQVLNNPNLEQNPGY